MMKTMLDIVSRESMPAPWTEGDNIPWNDPGFSERMLIEHLSQEHELASRKTESIDGHVDWIFSSILDDRPGRVLDLGCGPGLYAERLARRGCRCVGVDFSPASVRHASEVAAAEKLDCRYIHGDLRDQDIGRGFDLVMMIYGQFNVFPRIVGMELLKKALAALVPGGQLLLELQSADQIKTGGQAGPTWYSAAAGLFSNRPHLVLQEHSWDDDASASTIRFMVIDAATGAVSGYALSNEAYTDSELDKALRTAGFEGVKTYASLSGQAAVVETDLPVVVARRSVL
jgi:SAM-dependent methyltransferase